MLARLAPRARSASCVGSTHAATIPVRESDTDGKLDRYDAVMSPATACVAVLLIASPAAAEPDPCVSAVALSDFIVDGYAELVPGARCGSFVAGTDGAATAFSYGRFEYRKAVTLPYEITVTWRRLDGAPTRTLEINILGGAVMVRDGHWALYTTEAAFDSNGGWHAVPGLRISHEHTITLRQSTKGIEISIDGKPAGTAPPPPAITDHEISLALKGPRGVKSRMLFRDFKVTQLTPAAAGARP